MPSSLKSPSKDLCISLRPSSTQNFIASLCLPGELLQKELVPDGATTLNNARNDLILFFRLCVLSLPPFPLTSLSLNP